MNYVKFNYLDLIFYTIITFLIFFVIFIKIILPYIIKNKKLYKQLNNNKYWKNLFFITNINENISQIYKNNCKKENNIINNLEIKNKNVNSEISELKNKYSDLDTKYQTILSETTINNTFIKSIEPNISQININTKLDTENNNNKSEYNLTTTDNYFFKEDKDILKILKKNNKYKFEY